MKILLLAATMLAMASMACGGGGGGITDPGMPDPVQDFLPSGDEGRDVETAGDGGVPDAISHDAPGDSWNPEGTPCDDGDPCTRDDTFRSGVCRGDPYTCSNEGKPCIALACDGSGGCEVVSVLVGFCYVEDGCWEDGAVNPGDPCLVCDAATASRAWSSRSCADDNPCTTDRCDSGKGCVHEPAEGPCDDANACTLGDTCLDGSCAPGPNTPDCDDANVCTKDSCRPEVGCIHVRVSGPCDDGFACTTDDQCLGGVCSGQKTMTCPLCAYHENKNANKAVLLEIGASGHPGHGLDLDANTATCAPAADCSGGIDNELGLLAPFVNEGLQAAVQQGILIYTVEFVDFKPDGTPFVMHFLASDLADSNPQCDFQKEECDYYPLWEALDAACEPIVTFDNAVVTDSRITAGGPGYTFAFQAELIGGGHMELAIVNARFEAVVTMSQAHTIRSMDGFLGGGVDKADLLATVAQLPPDLFEPMDLAQVMQLLDQLIVNDLDTDLDGIADAASVAIRFRTIPADIVPR